VEMSQSHARVVLHITCSTKGRAASLKDLEMRKELYKYQAGILKEIKCHAILINGVADHLHILCNLHRTVSIAELIEKVKSASSAWVKKQGTQYAKFAWQSGYGAFSVSQSKVPEAKKYIANQETHHRKMSFQEEFRVLCEKHEIEIDERYVWD